MWQQCKLCQLCGGGALRQRGRGGQAAKWTVGGALGSWDAVVSKEPHTHFYDDRRDKEGPFYTDNI